MERIRLPAAFSLFLALSSPPGHAGPAPGILSFQDRLRAQEAIERIYYAHRIGSKVPFEEAVPREVLERKVTTSLAHSAALERFWDEALTAEMLLAELGRIVTNTHHPDRLRAISRALGDDPLLLAECLARPVLAGSRMAGFQRFCPERLREDRATPPSGQARRGSCGAWLPTGTTTPPEADTLLRPIRGSPLPRNPRLRR